MQNLLHQNADGTVSRIGYTKAGRIGGHRECQDTNIEVPDTLDDWLSTFAAMLGAARSVAMSIENFQRGKPPGVGGACCPILCLRLWSVVCNRLVMQRNAELQLARITLQTPPELRGTVARSFAAMACDYVGEIVDTIVGIVEYHSASMPLQERAKYESGYVAENFGKLAARWPKNRLSAEEWFRLVELELSACPWLAGTVGDKPFRVLLKPVSEMPPVDHSDNFNSVVWFGKQYTFTVKQAKVIERLWRAWERKIPAVPLVDLLEAADSDAKRLRDVFKPGQTVNPAWKDKMIIEAGKGAYRLSAPKNKEPR
jgi:hypothetical protein